MKILKFILLPFSLIYGIITFVRNKLYDVSFFKSKSFDFPIISIGNLSLGGTGKTPHTEYLIRLLSPKFKLATLSRGYGRKTKGYLIADAFTNANDIGDEPMQFHQKFQNIQVAVDENRVHGVKKLLHEEVKPEVVLLDDAFQHRRINPGLKILLTPYNDLYCNDYVVPAGRLREFRFGAKRADIVVVTKCPDQVSDSEKKKIHKCLKIQNSQSLFFSHIVYGDVAFGWDKVLEIEELIEYNVLLVTGIANPTPLLNHLKSYDINFKHLKFADHHNFTDFDILEIRSKMANLGSGKKIILTTEKDYVRLLTTKLHKNNLMYLPISIDFLGNESANFEKKVFEYVENNK
jgi:tetraacyldisaccharide 4'-kinase